MTKFQVGQKVFAWRFGWGTILSIVTAIGVDFPGVDSSYKTFGLDGRDHKTDLNPTLLTVEEAAKYNIFPEKKKVKKVIKRWANVYDNICFTEHPTPESAMRIAKSNAIAIAVPFEIHYEVESDE